jgi:hypothetical protein
MYSHYNYAVKFLTAVRNFHKLIDCLLPMECIPETQFLMRSRIHLAVLLHLRCKCEREEDYSQFEQLLLYACFTEEPGSNPELVFLNVYGAPEWIPRNEFRQPM